MQWYIAVLKKYAVFSGRARRKEYWMFLLFNLLISAGVGITDSVLGIGSGLSGLYSLAILLPSVAVSVRRLHDTGRSGWMMLIALIPLFGGLVLLSFMCEDSHGSNKYGDPPKFNEP
jgi:uncharacterized membrane protein YhaH (DUF805 family)